MSEECNMVASIANTVLGYIKRDVILNKEVPLCYNILPWSDCICSIVFRALSHLRNDIDRLENIQMMFMLEKR